jgi:hypothetical protein
MFMEGELSMRKISPYVYKKASWGWRARNMLRLPFILGWLAGTVGAKIFTALTGIPTMSGELRLRHIRKAEIIDYGVVGYRVVTNAFVNFLVDQLQTETAAIGDFKYHDSGTGTTAEAAGDTALVTAVESRATGSQTEGASANIYKSVGTVAYTATRAITEHGLFNASTGVTLMDRTVFSAVNVVNGESIEFTYQLTINSGG